MKFETIAHHAGWLLASALAIGGAAILAGVASGGPLEPADSPSSTTPLIEPRTPISQLPFDILEGGSYYLTKDLTTTPDPSPAAIRVFVHDVTLDLNGYTMRGVNNTPAFGIALVGPVWNVTIKNGVVENFGTGIDGSLSTASRVEDVIVREHADSGIVMGSSSTVEGCIVDGGGTAALGVSLHVRSVLRDCTVIGHTDFGVSARTYALIQGNQFVDNGSGDFFSFTVEVLDNDVTVRDNYFDSSSAARDVFMTAGKRAVIIDNVLSGCDSIAFGGGFTVVPTHGERHSNTVRTNGYCP